MKCLVLLITCTNDIDITASQLYNEVKTCAGHTFGFSSKRSCSWCLHIMTSHSKPFVLEDKTSFKTICCIPADDLLFQIDGLCTNCQRLIEEAVHKSCKDLACS